ncbi:uncharacterized protein [Maniola hyperantus]|uniref:uncharacterized protein n=1 Tax=Aphantopus hyperantus TaxID=2795564 RepID=UPI0037483068
MALTILRFCLFVPKFTYYLRCSPLWKFNTLLDNLDAFVKNILTSILNCPISNQAWSQASLPIRYGGLGIRKISSVSLPAFLSSVYSTHTLYGKIISNSLGSIEVSGLTEARNEWSMHSPSQVPVSLSSQRQWDDIICKTTFDTLLANANSKKDRARLLAVSAKESGYWLHALPSANLGTLLDHTTLSVLIGLRLGATINQPHRCHCGDCVDAFGHHGLSCSRSAGRFSRHSTLNDIIRRSLATAHVPAVLEPIGLARSDGKRPDGMTLVPWKMGRSLVWDATCVDTLAASHIQATSSMAGAAAISAEQAKRRKYENLDGSFVFVPFGVETLGPWGPGARALFEEIAKRVIESTGDPRAGSYLGQRISLAIQRGNAASILGTMPRCGLLL